MNRRKNNQAVRAASASVADENGNHEDTGYVEQSAVAEPTVDEEPDPMVEAGKRLHSFELTPGAKSLLDRALDNLANNQGVGLEDEGARLAVKQRAALVEAAGNDLSVVIDCLVAVCENPRDVAASVYSMNFNVLKAAGFIANLDYRRYLDPKGDFDLTPYRRVDEHGNPIEGTVEQQALGHDFEVDQRDEQSTAPLGLDTLQDRERANFESLYGEGDATPEERAMRELYGREVTTIEDIFAASLADLRVFLQLMCESFGWNPDNVMPFAFIMESNGTFTPINDPALALDHFEIKRKESQARRRAAETVRMAAAVEKARELAKAALRR